MTMETQPFEDVSPTKNGDFPASHVSFRVGIDFAQHDDELKKIFGLQDVVRKLRVGKKYFTGQKTEILLMAEILHLLIGSLSDYLQGFIHPRWLFGISSINSRTSISRN